MEIQQSERITAIYNRHSDTVYRICFMYMKNKNDANDMLQASFLSLIQNNAQFDNFEKEKAWLIVTASNHCKNQLKHWWRNKIVQIDQISEIPVMDETKSETLDLVLKLPSKYKAIVYLFYYEEYTTDEIAQMLNVNHSTIRTRLSKARQLLKISLQEDYYGKR